MLTNRQFPQPNNLNSKSVNGIIHPISKIRLLRPVSVRYRFCFSINAFIFRSIFFSIYSCSSDICNVSVKCCDKGKEISDIYSIFPDFSFKTLHKRPDSTGLDTSALSSIPSQMQENIWESLTKNPYHRRITDPLFLLSRIRLLRSVSMLSIVPF